MILHILRGQLKEGYPGEHAPEALAIIDEYGHSDNLRTLDPFGVTLEQVSLVSVDQGLAGRAGCAQTREAFRHWGAKLPEPGGQVKASPSTDTVRPQKKRRL